MKRLIKNISGETQELEDGQKVRAGHKVEVDPLLAIVLLREHRDQWEPAPRAEA